MRFLKLIAKYTAYSILALIALVIVVELSTESDATRKEYFSENREEVILMVKEAIHNENYREALYQSEKYLVSGDKDLAQLHAQVKNKVDDLDAALALEKAEEKARKVILSRQRKAEGKRESNISFQYSWSGSHRRLEAHTKMLLNDPDSYEHRETQTLDKGDHLIVRSRYTAKNKFGGRVRGTITAKVDVNSGRILSIIDHI